MRRVVVTGIGMISPLGLSVGATWPRLLEGKSCIGVITRFDVSDLPCKIAGTVNKAGEPPSTPYEQFDPAQWLEHKEIKKVDYFIMLAMAAAAQAADFSDAAHLTRTFFQMFGLAPSVMMRGECFEIQPPFETH